MTATHSEASTPYADAALHYREAGWPAPIPVTGKYPPVKGWTGTDGEWPSAADIQAWIEDRAADNIALRLPRNVIGIDVDHYGGKEGGATLAACEDRWGRLPQTWRSTSRIDRISGIRLYQIPEGGQWPGQLPGGAVETVTWSHRYCMVWPSLHPEGRTYRWTRDGVTALSIPKPSELPSLPVDWILALCKGRERHDARVDVGSGTAWISALPGASDSPCRVMASAGFAAVAAMNTGAGRHDTMKDRQLDIVRLAAECHPGGVPVLEALGEAFVALVTADRPGGETEARIEYMRALKGACDQVAANPSWPPMTQDPCTLGTGKTPALSIVSDADPSEFLAPETVPKVNSWCERHKISAALEGRLPAQPPTEPARADGALLLYPGKVNSLLGPSESGKTWIALLGAAQAMGVGRNVLMLDFEDDIRGLVARLRSLGVADEVIREHMFYLAPSEPLTPGAMAALDQAVRSIDPALIILDGVNAAMTTMGLDLVSNKDATAFHLSLLLPLSNIGAVVVVVDHTPKNDFEGISMGGIGAQAKRAAVTGASLKVEVVKNFDRGHSGLLKMTVDKDRGGHVRNVAQGHSVGIVHLEPGADGALSVRIEPPEVFVTDEGEFRPTVLMGRVAEYLTEHPGSSLRMILGERFGRDKYVRDAIDALVKDGYLSRSEGPRGAVLHSLIRVWPTTVAPLWPTVAQRGLNGTVASDCVPTGTLTTGHSGVAPDTVEENRSDGHGQNDLGGWDPDDE